MSKYIDADKLIAEINERLMAVNLEKLGNFGAHRVWAYNDVKDIIGSLQQEQSKKSTKKNCNNCPHCIDRKDQIGWHFRGCFGGQYKGKPIAEIEECPLQQEQPELSKDKMKVLLAWAKETYLFENASAIRKVCYKQLIDKLNLMLKEERL